MNTVVIGLEGLTRNIAWFTGQQKKLSKSFPANIIINRGYSNQLESSACSLICKNICLKSFIRTVRQNERYSMGKSDKIRVKQILHSEATKPIPELRKHLQP